MSESLQEGTRQLEMACVGMLVEREELRDAFYQQLPIEHFGSGTRDIAMAVLHLIDALSEINQITVLDQMRLDGTLVRAGGGKFLIECLAAGYFYIDGHLAIESLAGIFALREAQAATLRLSQALESGTITLGQWLATAKTQIEYLDRVEAGMSPLVMTTLSAFIEAGELEVDWCLPGLLPRGTATMLTAAEGRGKSVVLRQVALAAMAGIPTFEPWRTQDYFAPQRVLLVDCEVTDNQLRRSLSSQVRSVAKYAPDYDPKLLAVESHQAGLDLSRPHDQGMLHKMVREHRPDLLVIGPVYRFTNSDLNTEDGVRIWQKPLEMLMSDGVTVLTEHHAPNEQGGQLRMLRPIGSSAMRRWFSQGISLRGIKCASHDDEWCGLCPRRARVEAWRGSREEDASWPRYLTSVPGQVWWRRDEETELLQ